MSVVLVCAALAGFALLYTLWVPREEVYVPQPPSRLDHLTEKKKVLYDNLKDLNFEYRTGKLSDEDYQQLKISLQYEIAVLMKSIEELESRAAAQPAAPAEAAAGKKRREVGVCPGCGHRNPAGHKHCSECGARLAALVLALLLGFAAVPAYAQANRVAVEGSVQNGTTGKPAAALPVVLVQAGESKQTVGRVTTDAQGLFRFDPVEKPALPALLLVQAEYGGVRYSEAVPPMVSVPIALKIYDAGAPASAIRVAERAVILQPRGGKLLVNELYTIRNESNPPAAYAPAKASFRFPAPEGGSRAMQVAGQGAGGMSVPLEAKAEGGAPGVFGVQFPLKPGENRIEINYQLDYPGSLAFESKAMDKVERTRLAVAQGVSVEGQGIRFLATEPQLKFGIYDVASDGPWVVKLSGEATAAADSEGGAGAEGGGNDGGITKIAGPVEQRLYWMLGGVAAVLAAGFARLWRQQPPLAPGKK